MEEVDEKRMDGWADVARAKERERGEDEEWNGRMGEGEKKRTEKEG